MFRVRIAVIPLVIFTFSRDLSTFLSLLLLLNKLQCRNLLF